MHGLCPRRRRSKSVAAWLLAPLAVVTFGLPAPAGAEGPNAIQDLPGCTANALPASEDASSDLVPLGFTANFFGTSYDGVYVNENGNVTFPFPLGTFTPYDFTTSGDVIIAPFWADVSIGQGSSSVTYGQTTVDGSPAFCINWVNVGYYFQHADKLNSFQLLLVSGGNSPGDFDIVFNYDKILWETGDDSGGSGGFGGTSAAAGYANGDANPDHFFVQPGSGVPGTFLDSNQSTGLIRGSRGTSQLGRYIFEVRNQTPPELGQSVGVGVVSGTVRVRDKGTNQFRVLEGSETIPIGSSIDTTDGRAALVSETKTGELQTTDFYDGTFRVDQGRSGVTDLKLEGAKFGSCPRSSRQAKSSKKLARLWGSGGGRHRTKGRGGAGTVRGTIWLTEERCDGTLFKVKEGVLAVRDYGRKETVVLRAGEQYLARVR